MGLIQTIGQKYESMTEIEKKIYQYIMDNPLAFSLKSINEVAEDLNISKTSLMRFAKGLGFQGYSQFKKTLQEEQILDTSPAERMKKLYESDYINSAKKTKKQEIENIENTLMNINDVKFNKLISLIMNDNKIFTFGWNVSTYLADLFSFRLNHLGFNCNSLKREIIDYDEQLMYIKKDDLLIVFDFYKYAKAAERAVKIAKENGAEIVVITDNFSCPLCKYSELVFFCSAKTDLLMNSMVGPLFFINLVISEVLYRLDDKIIDLLDKRFKIINDSGEYF